MLERILKFSIHQRWVVLLATLAVAALGVYNYQRLPIDAVPDITNIQVQINTEAPGFSPLEAEHNGVQLGASITTQCHSQRASVGRPGGRTVRAPEILQSGDVCR